MNKYTVYKITNMINNKIYIGVTQQGVLQRFKGHCRAKSTIGNAIRKHGKENFKIESLYIFDNPDDMYLKEEELVTPEFIKNRTNYNECPGGISGFSSEFNPSKKMKNKLAHSKRMKGVPRTNNEKQLISKSLKEYYKDFIFSEEEKERRKQYAINNNPMHRPEVVEKFKGENNPSKRADVRAKIQKSLKGKPKPKTTCKKCGYTTVKRWMIEHEKTCNGTHPNILKKNKLRKLPDRYPCKHCGIELTKRWIKHHEQKCKPKK